MHQLVVNPLVGRISQITRAIASQTGNPEGAFAPSQSEVKYQATKLFDKVKLARGKQGWFEVRTPAPPVCPSNN